MKLSKRERFLVVLLLLVIIWALAYRFFIIPGYERLNRTRDLIWKLDGEKAQMDLYLEHFPNMEERLEGMNRSDDDFFYRGIDDAFMDRGLQDMAGRAGVEIIRMDFSRPAEVDTYTGDVDANDKDADKSHKAALGEGIVEAIVTLEVKGRDSASIMRFADEIYRESKSIVVSYMDMDAEHGNGADGTDEYKGMSGIVEVRYYYEDGMQDEIGMQKEAGKTDGIVVR